MKKFLVGLFTLFFISSAHAVLVGGVTFAVPPAPALRNITVNIGELTATGEGAPYLDDLLLTNNVVPTSYDVADTSNSGYYQVKCGDGAAHTLTSTPYNLSNDCSLTTPQNFIGDPGSNYTINDILPLSNGMCLKVTDAEIDYDRSISGRVYTVHIENPGTTPTPSAEGIGNTTIVSLNVDCSLYLQNIVAGGATFTWVYKGKAWAWSPTSAGATAKLGYTQSPANCNSTHNCVPNLAAVSFSVTGHNGAATSNTATVSVNLIPDAANTTDMQNLNGGINVSADDQIFKGNLATFRTSCRNCTTGGSSVGDMTILYSTGMRAHNPNTDTCCGIPYRYVLYGVNYAAAVLAASGTPSVNDLLTFEDACRATGTVMVAATANRPAENECDPNAGGTLGTAVFDVGAQLVGYNVTNNGTGANGACYTGGGVGYGNNMNIAFIGITIGGTPRYNYINMQDVKSGAIGGGSCNIWFTNIVAQYNYTLDATGQVTDYPAGLYTIGFGYSGFLNHINVDQLFLDGSANGFWNDSGNQGVLNVSLRDAVIQNYVNNAIAPGPEDYLTIQDTMVFGSVGYPLSALHPDVLQNNALQLYPDVNSTYQRILFGSANGNVSVNGINWGNCQLGLQQRAAIVKAVAYTGNSYQGVLLPCEDMITSGSSSYSGITLLRQEAQYPATNGSNPANGTISVTNPTNGQTLKIGVGCQPVPYTGPTSCSSQNGWYQDYDVITFVSGTPANEHEIHIGADAQTTMTSLANALGITAVDGTCAGVPPTALSISMAAFQLAHGGAGVRLCADTPVGSGSFHVYMDQPGSAGYMFYPWCSGSFTKGVNVCGSGWMTSQFTFFENDYFSNKPQSYNNGAVSPQGVWFDFGNTASQGTNCSTNAYCGDGTHQLTIDKTVVWDNFQASVAYNTVAAAQAGMGAAFNVTNDNYIMGNHSGCTLNTTCFNTGIFASDSGTTVEAQLEAIDIVQWKAMNPYQKCMVYLGPTGTQTIGGVSVSTGLLKPKTGGPLDLGGGNWIGVVTGVTTPLWNDGSGKQPCANMNNKAYPFYHLTAANG